MPINEIRVVLTDSSGNDLGLNKNATQDKYGGLATGVVAGAAFKGLKSGISPFTSTGQAFFTSRENLTRGTSADMRAWNRKEYATDLRMMFRPPRGASRDPLSTRPAIGYVKNMEKQQLIKSGAGAVTAGLQVANLGFDIAEHNASTAGNTHKAAYLSNTQSVINDLSGIAIAAAINPALALPMIAFTAYKKVMEHDKFIKEMQVESIQSAYHAQRVGYTISSSGRVTV